MVKLVSILVRDNDYTYEELIERWRGSHVEPMREFPGLMKYTTSIPTDPEWSEYDGIVELYFEDMAVLKVTLGSEIDQRVNADAAALTDIERGPTLYAEETAHLDRS